MKRIVALTLSVLLLVLCVPMFAGAAELHLLDEAGLLTEEEASQVESALAEASRKIHMDVLIRTTNSIGDKTAIEFGDDAMVEDFGYVTDGILLLVFNNDSENKIIWYAATRGRGAYTFGDKEIEEISASFISELPKEENLVGFTQFADAVVSVYQSKYTTPRHILDGAGLLSGSELDRVEKKLSSVSEELGFDVLVRTTDSLYGKGTMAFADDSMDYEFGDVSNGILFLISMEYRDWYVSTKGTCFHDFDDDDIDEIVDRFLYKISAGDYEEGFIGFADSVAKEYRYQTSTFHFDFISIGVPLVVALIIASVVVSIMKSQLKSARFRNANQYLKQGSLILTQNVDLFLYSNVTRTRIQSESSSGGGGGHISSSGSTHGGHGGKF